MYQCRIILCIILLSNLVYSSSIFKDHEKLDNFVHDSNKFFGSDEYFVRRLGFKYANNYISQLKYSIINTHLNELQLDRAEFFYSKIFAYISNYKAFFFVHLVISIAEICILLYMVFLKLEKQNTRAQISPDV